MLFLVEAEVFWTVTPYSDEVGCQRFRRSCSVLRCESSSPWKDQMSPPLNLTVYYTVQSWSSLTPCRDVVGYQRFGATCYLLFHGESLYRRENLKYRLIFTLCYVVQIVVHVVIW